MTTFDWLSVKDPVVWYKKELPYIQFPLLSKYITSLLCVGQHSGSRSRSRSRSRGRRSRSASLDRERKRKRDKTEKRSDSKTASSKSKISVKDEDLEKNDSGENNSTTYVPSADALAKIESNNFIPETFVPQRSKQAGDDDTVNSQDRSHEDAIFGVSGSERLVKDATSNKPIGILRETPKDESGIMASLLHKREESKNDRWIKKLHSMRQKKLLDSPGQ